MVKIPPFGSIGANGVAKLFGIKYGQLKNWLEAGYVEASDTEAHGDGVRRFFTVPHKLYEFEILIRLKEMGIKLPVAGQWIEHLSKIRPGQIVWTEQFSKIHPGSIAAKNIPDFLLFGCIGGRVERAVLCSKSRLVTELEGFDDAYVINFPPIVVRVNDLMKKL